jgi:uncharacterized membrane protein YvbJ
MVFCSNCGTDLPEEAYFCFNCGVRTAKGIEANVSMPYREIVSDIEKQLEKAALTASEEIKNVFDKAREDIRKAVSK